MEWVNGKKMETYGGVVESYDASTGEHTILYEDNDRAPTVLGEQEDAGLLTWRDPTTRPAPTRAEEAEGEGVAAVATEAEGLRLHLSSSGSTGYKGVSRRPTGRFEAHRSDEGKKIHLGSFDTAVEGAVAYARAVGEAPGQAEVAAAAAARAAEAQSVEAACGAARAGCPVQDTSTTRPGHAP